LPFRFAERWSDARSIAWEVLLLIGGGLALGKVLINTGASKLFSDFILSYFTGIHPLIVLMVIMYMAIFLANFVNNSSTVIILVPTLMALGDSMNLSPIMLALAVAHAVALSFITPISIPAFSIIYSTHLVDRKDMIKSGLIIGFINTIIVSFILILYSTWRGF